MKKILFSLLLILAASAAMAQTYIYGDDGLKYTALGGDSVEVAKNAETDSLFIPATVTEMFGSGEYRVVGIGEDAFRMNDITSLVIADGVRYIGDYAFEMCASLTSVVIPGSVKTIGRYAFYQCSALASVSIGYGVTTIGNSAFRNCMALSPVTIPRSVTTIDQYAFDNVPKIFYSGTAEGSPWGALSSAPAESYYVDGDFTYTSAAEDTLLFCASSFAGVANLPQTLRCISEYAFKDCAGLTGVSLPAGLLTIGDGAFRNCGLLTSVAFPDSLISIGDYAFSGTGLSGALIIPDSVASIGVQAFAGCSGLDSLVLGAGLQSIGGFAFLGDSLIRSITCYAVNPPSAVETSVSSIPDATPLYVPVGSKTAYKTRDVWSRFFIKGIGEPDALSDTDASVSSVRKVLRNGRVLILTPAGTFDAAGRQVE